MIFLRTICLLIVAVQVAQAQTVDYLREVKPILAGSCYTCHGAIKQKAGLRLDTVALMTAGGEHGAVIVPGKADDSVLLKHIRADKGFKRMPPEHEGEMLKPAQVAAIKRWIEQGAPHP